MHILRLIRLALYAAAVVVTFLHGNCSAQSAAQSPDPPRVRIYKSGQIWTVRTGTGNVMRGVAVPVYLYQRQAGQAAYLKDPAYWDLLKANRINAIRLVAFDGWQRSHGKPGSKTPYPYTNLNDAVQLRDLLSEMDAVVNMAGQRGMVVMINFHDTGNYKDPDYSKPADANGQFPPLATRQYVTTFWSVISRRYAARTHVFFELLNEPVKWKAADYTATDVANFKQLFTMVRTNAPQTHITVLSFATHYPSTGRTNRQVCLDLQAAGIDFSNASIGFHPYNERYPRNNDSTYLMDLMRSFPVINTEQNFPKGMITDSSDPDSRGLDGDLMGTQSMERLGISWFHWNSGIPTEFNRNFRRFVIPDAKAKAYLWKPLP